MNASTWARAVVGALLGRDFAALTEIRGRAPGNRLPNHLLEAEDLA